MFEFSFIHHCKIWFPCYIYVDISTSVVPLDLVSKARFKLEGVGGTGWGEGDRGAQISMLQIKVKKRKRNTLNLAILGSVCV